MKASEKKRTAAFFRSLREHNLVFVMLFALILFFSVLSPRFFSLMNFKNMILQNTHLFVITVGLTIIMSGGGLDFSVNYQISLISVLIGLMFERGFGVPAVMLLILVTGLACGLFNGILVSYFHVVPILATILTGFLFNGLANIISKGFLYTGIPVAFRALAQSGVVGMSLDVWVALASFLVALFIFEFTVLGKYIRALGSSGTNLLIQAGIDTNRLKVIAYMLGSGFFAISAAILVARQGMAGAQMGGTDYGILSLSAVYIGGIIPGVFRSAQFNQRASVVNAMAGVFVIAVIRNGVQLAEMNQYAEYVMIGIALLVAVMLKNTDPFGYRMGHSDQGL